jgi:hypothetical protein
VGGGISADVCVRILNAEKSADIRRIASEQNADLIIVGRGRERGSFSVHCRSCIHLFANHRALF